MTDLLKWFPDDGVDPEYMRPASSVDLTAYPYPQPDRPEDWQDEASCLGVGWDLFYPEMERGSGGKAYSRVRREAKSVCDRCPVKAQCLAYGMEEEFGIWGGLTPRERRKLRGVT